MEKYFRIFFVFFHPDSVKYAHKTKVRATTIKGGNFVLYLFMALSAKLWLFTWVNRKMKMIKNHRVRKLSSIEKRFNPRIIFPYVVRDNKKKTYH